MEDIANIRADRRPGKPAKPNIRADRGPGKPAKPNIGTQLRLEIHAYAVRL